MIEIEKNGKVVFIGEKKDAIKFLNKKGLDYKNNNIPLLVLGNLATKIGYYIYIR